MIMDLMDNKLTEALGIIESLKGGNLVLYGFNVVNNEAALVQSGEGYRTMAVVDSALGSSGVTLSAGDLIKREANSMSFIVPSFYRALFIVATLNLNSGTPNTYNRIMLDYGAGSSREIARTAQTTVDRRHQNVLIGTYAGITPYREATKEIKLRIETYGTQSYFGANVLIGCVV